jgi:subtilisin family serine protease
MKKILFTLLAMSTLLCASAQMTKCAIDTKALVGEEIASGATEVRFLAKMAPGFNRGMLEKAGIVIGSQAGDIVTLTVPVASLRVLERDKEVLQYSISHRVGGQDCNATRKDTRTDSVQNGWGVTDSMMFTGEGVYIGITDWGFDYTHPNFNGQNSTNWRIDRIWDHFRLKGPAPAGYDYGTELVGYDKLYKAKGDTSNLYGYGTHGTHVTGIAAGRGVSGNYRGQAPWARLLLCSFGLGEAEWLDAVCWMHKVAQDSTRRLVINSSWGMYTFSTLDGTSLLCQAIDSLSNRGVTFVTSAGNNGDENFHVSRTFSGATDTLKTVATYYNYTPEAIGQALIIWGEEGHDFTAGFRMLGTDGEWHSPMFSTADGDSIVYDTLQCGDIRIPYRALIEHANIYDNRPHIQLDVTKDLALQLQLFITAQSGTVHAWNVANKINHAGNEGTPFSAWNLEDFTGGDNNYGIGEPACAAKCISVAAHYAASWSPNGDCLTGGNSEFTSYGPLINGMQKPEISAPGSNVISSISAWTTSSYISSFSYNDGTTIYKWAALSGTSMSSPAVTGIVALMLQANPKLYVDQIRDIICTTARNDDKTGPLLARDSASVRWGWGKINALHAVNAAIARVSIQTAEENRLPLHIMPNPACDQVRINTGCGEPQTLHIYGIDGREVMQLPVATEATIYVTGWPRGIYILRAGSRIAKLIKQ